MKRKLLSIVLALCLTLTLLPTATFAAGSYADTNGHWAEAAIERWSGYGILQGADGKFSPDGTLTRAQMATILSRLLALPEASSYGFTDVAAGDWFADAIDRCAAAGIMQGTGGKAEPNAPITREQAMVMLCRALGIDAVAANLSGYPDGAQVSAYAAGYVAALVQMGIVKGDANGKLNPAGNITRAEIVTIIDRLITVYANVDGAVINAANGGTVLVTAKNVSIANAPEGTKVIAAKGADGLSVNGKPVAAGQTYIVPSSEDGTSYTPGTGTYVPHKHTYTYTDNGDGTHTGVCACGNSTVEEHTIKDGRCVLCRAVLTTDTAASVKNSDGTYTYFETLAEAIDAAKDGDTVTVVSGGSENFVVPSGKDITLDLNGCEITTSKQPKIEEGGSLTIRGEGGSIILEEAGIYLEGSLTLESGKIESKKNSDVIFIMGNGNFTMTGGMLLADAGACIDASYLTNGVSRLNITGGVVETKDPSVNAIYINNRWGSGKIELTISGGTIKAAKQAVIALDDSVSTISLTGGTYSSNPSAYVADGYITLVNGDGTFTVSNTNEIPVTIATAQDYLDGKYGSINGKTLVLGEGNYDKIEFGRATAYKGSNTEYYRGDITSTVDEIKQDIANHPNGGAKNRVYVRNMSDVTLKAADGAAVTINGLVAFGGQVNSTKWYSRDFVADRDMSATENNNICYWIGQNWSNITFEGLTFTDGVNIEAYGNDKTNIDNVRFDNCQFSIVNNANETYCIRLNVDGNIAKANNLIVAKCVFTNGLTAVLTDGMPNVTVTDSTFSGLVRHAINPMMNYLPNAPGYGEITVTGNTFKNMSTKADKGTILRMGIVGAGAVFTIQNNTATVSITLANSIKVESLAEGITYNISGNNWGSLTASDPRLDG